MPLILGLQCNLIRDCWLGKWILPKVNKRWDFFFLILKTNQLNSRTFEYIPLAQVYLLPSPFSGIINVFILCEAKQEKKIGIA